VLSKNSAVYVFLLTDVVEPPSPPNKARGFFLSVEVRLPLILVRYFCLFLFDFVRFW
jgi:hypothetical protein